MNEIVQFEEEFSVLNPKQIENAMQAMKDNKVLSDINLIDRVKVPTAGGNSYSIPGIDGDEDFKSFYAIILAFNDHRVYYTKPFNETGGGDQPDCFSDDMVKGIGDPGGNCLGCINNEWESAENGKGKACAEKRMIMLLLPNRMIPVKLDAPSTSLLNLRKYFMRLASVGISFHQVVTKFTLEKDKSEAGIEYSKVIVSMETKLSEDQKKGVVDFTDALNK